jgi:hypothetical protein
VTFVGHVEVMTAPRIVADQNVDEQVGTRQGGLAYDGSPDRTSSIVELSTITRFAIGSIFQWFRRGTAIAFMHEAINGLQKESQP